MSLFKSIEQPIEHWVHAGLHYAQMHPHMGFLFAFIISFAESLPVVGTVVPGSITMTAVGTLIGTGILPFSTTIGFAIIGAFMGDYIGYFLGFRYHDRIRNTWPFKKHPKILDKGEEFFHRHGGKSILIGRFVGPLRSAMPLVAGCLQLTSMRFILAAFPSAILWALAYTIPGIVLGALSTDLPKGQVAKFLIAGAIVIVILWAILWVIKSTATWIYQMYRRYSSTLWQDMLAANKFSYFKNPENPQDDMALRLLLMSMIFLILFILIWIGAKSSTVLHSINHAIMFFLANARHPLLFHIMLHATLLANKVTLLGLLILYSIFLFRSGNTRAIAFIWLCSILTTIVTYGIKILNHSPRPNIIAIPAHSSSFPSGHVALALAVYGSIAYLLAVGKSRLIRQCIYTALSVIIAAVAFSRMYLGMHWLTDVIASILLVTALLDICKASYPQNLSNYQPPKNEAAWLLIAFIIPYIGSNVLSYNKNLKQTSLKQKSVQIDTSLQFWWQHPDKLLAGVRLNRIGQPSQALNIQWVGSLDSIMYQLQLNGWHTIQHSSHLQTTLKRFASYAAQDHMPLFAPLFQYQKTSLTMIKHGPNKKIDIEIRLWPTNINFSDSNQPLWTGNISYHYPPSKIMGLKKAERSYYSLANSITVLQPDLNKNIFDSKPAHFPIDKTLQQKLEWNGTVLLIKPKRKKP